jgi:hypothetical protein
METYTLEFIAILPDESKQLNDVATVLAQPDELFPSKFIHHENNHCVVGTPIAPRYMEIVPFGDPPKKGMFGINVHLSTFNRLFTNDGYSHESIRTQIHDLCQQGIIEIYNYDSTFSLKATRSIRRVRD